MKVCLDKTEAINMSKCSIIRIDDPGYELKREIKKIEKELERQIKRGTPYNLLREGIKELQNKKKKLREIKKGSIF